MLGRLWPEFGPWPVELHSPSLPGLHVEWRPWHRVPVRPRSRFPVPKPGLVPSPIYRKIDWTRNSISSVRKLCALYFRISNGESFYAEKCPITCALIFTFLCVWCRGLSTSVNNNLLVFVNKKEMSHVMIFLLSNSKIKESLIKDFFYRIQLKPNIVGTKTILRFNFLILSLSLSLSEMLAMKRLKLNSNLQNKHTYALFNNRFIYFLMITNSMDHNETWGTCIFDIRVKLDIKYLR